MLAARVDLRRPAHGLFDVAIDANSASFGHSHLLGIEIPSLVSGEESLFDEYVRSTSLTAVYQPSNAWPIRVDVSWHAMAISQLPPPSTAIDMLVSVRTERLDSRPELAVISALSAVEVLRLMDAKTARYQSVTATPTSPLSIDKQTGPGCLLFRLPEAEVSYVEMIHPLDFQRDEFAVAPGATGTSCLRHHLFPPSLEKGVILRSRVRGVFVPRQEDERLASAAFLAFAGEEPRLGI